MDTSKRRVWDAVAVRMMKTRPFLWILNEWYARAYRRGYAVATARAESRVALGLPLDRGGDQAEMSPEQAEFEYAFGEDV